MWVVRIEGWGVVGDGLVRVAVWACCRVFVLFALGLRVK